MVLFDDGGTHGLALLDRIANRRALLVLDAVAPGAEPGTVHVLGEHRELALIEAVRGRSRPGQEQKLRGELQTHHNTQR